MKYKSLTILFLSFTLFGGCFNNRCTSGNPVCGVEDGPAEIVEVDPSFLAFADSIPVLKPNTILTSEAYFDHVDLSSDYIPDGAALIGRLIPFKNHELIIYSYPADIRLPILEVYNSNGEKVNERQLFKYGYCSTELLNLENSHRVDLSKDGNTFYLTTVCGYSDSAGDYDSIVVHDLIPD